jgi:hypothetical protein
MNVWQLLSICTNLGGYQEVLHLDLRDNPHTFMIKMLKWFMHKSGAWFMLMSLISIPCSFGFSQNMVDKIIFGKNIGIWDSRETERVIIWNGSCRNPSLIPIYVISGAKTCVVVLIETMFEAFQEHKLFFLTLVPRYFRSTVGMEIF